VAIGCTPIAKAVVYGGFFKWGDDPLNASHVAEARLY
jgi:hypothetical protein